MKALIKKNFYTNPFHLTEWFADHGNFSTYLQFVLGNRPLGCVMSEKTFDRYQTTKALEDKQYDWIGLQFRMRITALDIENIIAGRYNLQDLVLEGTESNSLLFAVHSYRCEALDSTEMNYYAVKYDSKKDVLFH